MEIFISVLALLLTSYSLYMQRIHNVKSLKPLGQIELLDNKNHIHIFIQNSGVGPLIIDKLTLTRNGNSYTSISDCLNLNPQSYWHMPITDSIKKVILPNTHFIVFEKNAIESTPAEIEAIRKQLSSITVKVDYRDIYDNTFSFERNLEWFSRHYKD